MTHRDPKQPEVVETADVETEDVDESHATLAKAAELAEDAPSMSPPSEVIEVEDSGRASRVVAPIPAEAKTPETVSALTRSMSELER